LCCGLLMKLSHLLLVGAGGCLGSMARFATASILDKRLNLLFPMGTLFVNVVGSCLLGIIVGFLSQKGTADGWRIFLGVGFCGGFTTFSAFALEAVRFAEQGLAGQAFLYVALSLAGSLLALWGGYHMGAAIH